MSLPKVGKLKLEQDGHAFLERLNENVFIKAEMISVCSSSNCVCVNIQHYSFLLLSGNCAPDF